MTLEANDSLLVNSSCIVIPFGKRRASAAPASNTQRRGATGLASSGTASGVSTTYPRQTDCYSGGHSKQGPSDSRRANMWIDGVLKVLILGVWIAAWSVVFRMIGAALGWT